MEIRDTVGICFGILSLCFYGVTFWGYKELDKAKKELENQNELEIVKEETLRIILRGYRLIIVGIVSATIFGLLAVLLLHDVI